MLPLDTTRTLATARHRMICNATAVTIENFRASVVHLFDGKAEAPAEAHVLWALESCPAQSEQTEVLKRKTRKVFFLL